MDKKAFYFIISIVLVAFIFTMLLTYFRPESAGDVDFDNFPLEIGEWKGKNEKISQTVIDLLNPMDITSITYVNNEGISIHLFFDYFSSDASFGGPHSPRNCVPGSGWIVENSYKNNIQFNGKVIPAGVFELQFEQSQSVMEFWYVTHFGETANDYEFKLYELLSALTFSPRDVAFIRFVADNDPKSLEALKEFQSLVIPEIYSYLPF
jgi:EpsI family protein